MPKGEKVDIFSEYKFSLGYVVMKRTVGGMMKGEKRELERSEIIFTHDLLIFYVNFKCCSVEKDWSQSGWRGGRGVEARQLCQKKKVEAWILLQGNYDVNWNLCSNGNCANIEKAIFFMFSSFCRNIYWNVLSQLHLFAFPQKTQIATFWETWWQGVHVIYAVSLVINIWFDLRHN